MGISVLGVRILHQRRDGDGDGDGDMRGKTRMGWKIGVKLGDEEKCLG